ncbi:fumarylacetoacetate hydrolase family protein [Ensifer sp. ENS07]|uniref:2-keto-4-pentenoate hydratase n=1 Tax=Ensifer sp. ENS07 TaxID=2769274 RepID=UPI0017844BFB|nr:fumarylacetoacetate hydrolase family protein [Ensifer sp. ENS07]MBD9641757.1 fumarylacetoacetate hydrolase family protein [Ensifer sp. ENS07]
MGKSNTARVARQANLAEALISAAANGEAVQVGAASEPATTDEAYRVQSAFSAGFGKTIGWKVGRKSPEVAPSCAPLFRSRTYQSGASIATDAFRLWRLETEIAFRVARDLPARSQAYSRSETAAALGEMLVCFEVVDSRFAQWPEISPLLSLADLMSHGGMVLGDTIPFDPSFDFMGAKVGIRIGEEDEVEGMGNPAGDPIDLIAWLAEKRGLKAGDLVTTGSYTGMNALLPGTTATGTVVGIGSVSARRNGDAAADQS